MLWATTRRDNGHRGGTTRGRWSWWWWRRREGTCVCGGVWVGGTDKFQQQTGGGGEREKHTHTRGSEEKSGTRESERAENMKNM